MTNYLLPVATGSQVSNEFDGINHFGIDFAVSSGSSVNAINDGLVIRKIADHPKFGNVLIINQRDGTAALYAHLSSFGATNVGDEIAQGSEIALSGATANGTQHLHLEIISGSAAISTIAESLNPEIGIADNLYRTNPRPLFNTRYTETEFTRTVVANAAEITADSRDNKVKSTNIASDTMMYGNAGNDKYFFDFTKDGGYLATHYTISDTDLDGAIEVAYGDGTYVTLSGNARAKTDDAGNVIANNWVFSQGFEAKLDGSNLVIFKAGADIADDSVGRIIIENYSDPRSFGFTLGKTTDLDAYGTSITGYDEKTVSLTENRRFLGGTFLQADDGFYAPVLQETTGFSAGYRYRLGQFNSAGVLIDQFELSDEHEATNMLAPIKYTDPNTGLESLAIPYSSQYTDASNVIQTRVGICLVDKSGKRTSATIASASGSSRVNTANFLQQAGNEDDDSINPGDTYSNFIGFTYRTQAGQRLLQKVDMSTLEKLGSTVAIAGNFQATFESSNTLQFSDGNKVTITAGTSVAAQLPKLRNQVGTEIIPNYTPNSSQYVTSGTVEKSIISVNPNQDLDLIIISNPDSVTVLMADSAFANIDSGTGQNITFSLPVSNLSQASVYSTSSSLEEILSGTIIPSSRRVLTAEEENAALVSNNNPKLVAKIWEKNVRGSTLEYVDPLKASLPEDVFGKPERKHLRFEAKSAISEDNFLTTEDITLDEVDQPITIIELLEGQKVVLVGKNATEVEQSLATYFSTQDLTPTAAPSYFLTFVPTGSPITLVPTLLPTVDPTTGQPTKNPTFVPSKTPSGEPTWTPSEDPSSGPTYTPSIDPSGNPTMVPTLSPTGLPTPIPTFSPSYSPSGVPSLNPSFVPTESPTLAPSGVPSQMPTLSPTLSPTGKPSLVPTLLPTGEPTELPSYIPTCDPTRIPTIQLTRAPTNLPSNFPTVTLTTNPTTLEPTLVPSFGPTQKPSDLPTIQPSFSPTQAPTVIPSVSPTALPTEAPSKMPTFAPTMIPSDPPTTPPTLVPSLLPTTNPTGEPTRFPTFVPTIVPSKDPTQAPTVVMTEAPTDHPSDSPSFFPTFGPTGAPTWMPTTGPTVSPSELPSVAPSSDPTKAPTITPSINPSSLPSPVPTRMPSFIPSARPSVGPSGEPTLEPTLIPTDSPTSKPSGLPTEMPVFTWNPSSKPSYQPVADPSSLPSGTPTFYPSFDPTVEQTVITFLPTGTPTRYPTITPSSNPTSRPTFRPSPRPTLMPSYQPTMVPSNPPTIPPSHVPSVRPTVQPTVPPTLEPTYISTPNPTGQPSVIWTKTPTDYSSSAPTWKPSSNPTTGQPTMVPTTGPSYNPSAEPSIFPSSDPSKAPTFSPSSKTPTRVPSRAPTTYVPTYLISSSPSEDPSVSSAIEIMPSSLPSDKGKPSSYPSREEILSTRTPSNAPVGAISGGNNEGLSTPAWGGIAAGIIVGILSAIGGIRFLWRRNINQRQANKITPFDNPSTPPFDNPSTTFENPPEKLITTTEQNGNNDPEIEVVNQSGQSEIEGGETIQDNTTEIRVAKIVEETGLLDEDHREPVFTIAGDIKKNERSEVESVDEVSKTVDKNPPGSTINPNRYKIAGPTTLDIKVPGTVTGGRNYNNTVHLEPLDIKDGGGERGRGGGRRGGGNRNRNTSKEIGKTIPDGKDGHK